MHEKGFGAIGKTIVFAVRDFKARSKTEVRATACESTKYLSSVNLELDGLPEGTAARLVGDTRCRRIYGKVGGSFGGTNSVYIVKVLAFID